MVEEAPLLRYDAEQRMAANVDFLVDKVVALHPLTLYWYLIV
jgi:hypothetical protein